MIEWLMKPMTMDEAAFFMFIVGLVFLGYVRHIMRHADSGQKSKSR